MNIVIDGESSFFAHSVTLLERRQYMGRFEIVNADDKLCDYAKASIYQKKYFSIEVRDGARLILKGDDVRVKNFGCFNCITIVVNWVDFPL